MANKKYNIPKEELGYKYSVLGMTIKEIANGYNCNNETIRLMLIAYDIKRRNYKEYHDLDKFKNQFIKYRVTKEYLIYRYVTCGLSTVDIGNELNCTGANVILLLKYWGIKRRTLLDCANTDMRKLKVSNSNKGKSKKVVDIVNMDICKPLIEHIYLDKQMPMSWISMVFNHSESAMKSLFLKYNIPLRSASEVYSMHTRNEKLSKAYKGNQFKGHKHTEEYIKRMSLITKNRWKYMTEEEKNGIKEKTSNYKKLHPQIMSKDTIEKMRKLTIERYKDPNERIKTGKLTRLACKNNPNILKKKSESMKNTWASLSEEKRKEWINSFANDEVKTKRKETYRANWEALSDDDRNIFIKKLMGRMHIRPTVPELQMKDMLNKEYPDQWKYVGDGQIIINGKNPDFININGRKLIIEVFGDYFHQGENPQDRIDMFQKYGFDALVIWQSELSKHKDKVLNKIQRFVETSKK